MPKFKASFWIGFIASIAGISLFTGAWFYYHQTKPVAYLNKTLETGSILNFEKDVVIKNRQLPDLPENYIDPELLKSKTWRVIHTIDPTDPLSQNKLTDKSIFTMDKNQMFVSHSFSNSGLLSYVMPGDKIAISEGDKTLTDILVLGKADKNGKIINLLSSLKDSAIGANPIFAKLTDESDASADSLILLMTLDQKKILDQMKKPDVEMYGRPQMIKDGGVTSGQTLVNSQPSQSR